MNKFLLSWLSGFSECFLAFPFIFSAEFSVVSMSLLILISHYIKVSNTEYDEHKGRIAIGWLHAGELQHGMEVKV